ncbi:unnamed protein product [Staurois parvus]|uniref:Uncharacterized protein n=1 Tax=Staurois parvus TaxID=386267 RepID=A0ABN9AB76_9NEOB|nr:unnamed protein product [Staurois parvus]
MKSPIRGPCFENPQHTDCTGVCRPFYRVLTIVLGSTPADGLIYCRGNWLFSFLIYSLSLFWDLEPGDFKEIWEG